MLRSVQNSKKNCVWKSYIWDPAKYANGKNDKNWGSTIDNSFVCDEIIETTKSILKRTVLTKSTSTNFNRKKIINKMKNLYILLTFLVITMELLIAATFIVVS